MKKYTITKQCEQCGKDYECPNAKTTIARRHHCSRKCAALSKKLNAKRYTIKCEHCGKEVEVDVKGKNNRYCSIRCAALNRPHPKDPSKWATFTCQWCGKEFEDYAYRQPTMCSRQCASEYGARQPKPNAQKPENFLTLNCVVCGKLYTVHKSWTENGRKSQCCSAECRSIATSERMKGDGNHNYKGGTEFSDRGSSWSTQRKRAFKRDNCRCQICGYRHKVGVKRRKLDVHHIVPYKHFKGDHEKANELSNLITLCRTCHSKVEHHGLPCPRKLL